ncbi:hypothetical protein FACS1894158_17700 [Betaproteobacteria bacterium]|nr:hypothetical protein FACS1894158_17700 [Betaproteobacteria bacterium]
MFHGYLASLSGSYPALSPSLAEWKQLRYSIPYHMCGSLLQAYWA